LQHVVWEGPGLIASEAKARDLQIDIRRLDLGAAIPEADEVECLVVMGGPMGVYESDRHPFLVAESRLMAELVRRNRPVLGVCLGAQVLAWALGARVFPGHVSEIGFGAVELTADGVRDPVLAPAGPSVPVFHWHGDTFDLPEGATLLASSKDYPHQAFRIGIRVYGLQFHVEPDSVLWPAWYEHLPPAMAERSEPKRQAIEHVGRGIISRFFDVARYPERA
jgi:GMP synthase (glutamine-hydrolysing)